jgi:hypothetical protein
MTAAQRELHAVTGEQLRASFGDVVAEAADQPAYFVARGSIGVRVNVEPVGDDDAVLEAYSWVAQGLPITPALAMHLIERNSELRFGALSVDGEGAIILAHSLFADGANPAVLARLVEIIAESAEALDTELRARFEL